MAEWQVTATTIYCKDVGEEVTLLIYGDGTARCTGREKGTRPEKDTKKTLKRTGKRPGCAPGECHQIAAHREKWLGEKSTR